MKCMKCGMETFKSTTTEAVDFGYGVLVIRNIPCFKCEECDEILYTGDVVMKLEGIKDSFQTFMDDLMKGITRGIRQDVTVVDYEKAA